MTKRTHAVVAIIQRHGTFLLVKRSDYTKTASGYWCPVSGRIEMGETQEEALKREVMEEVGLEVTATEKVAEINSADDRFVLHFWRTDIISGEAHINSDEATALQWFTLAELKELQPTFKEDIEILGRVATTAKR
jgi:8-oxo-dGTP diphosphatase